MELIELRAKVLADSPSYKDHKRTVAALTKRGRVREAIELQSDYEARLARWKQLIKNNVNRAKNSSHSPKAF
jgi:hypothetical protein